MIVKRIALVVILVLVLMALTTTVVWAQDGDTPEGGEASATDVLLQALAPIVAIATAVERVLEVFWDRWEKANKWPNKKGVLNTGFPEYISSKKLGSHILGTVLA
ncbi:MAG: hypothetical protein ACK2US_01575, partial [Anaerolineae bacterium]